MANECSIDASLSLLGGTIFHFIMGIKTMWGNIAPYVVSASGFAVCHSSFFTVEFHRLAILIILFVSSASASQIRRIAPIIY